MLVRKDSRSIVSNIFSMLVERAWRETLLSQGDFWKGNFTLWVSEGLLTDREIIRLFRIYDYFWLEIILIDTQGCCSNQNIPANRSSNHKWNICNYHSSHLTILQTFRYDVGAALWLSYASGRCPKKITFFINYFTLFFS